MIENKEGFLSKLKKENIQLHESIHIEEGSPYVCTLMDCHNRITINLPKSLKLKPDTYVFSITVDKSKTKKYMVTVDNIEKEKCVDSKHPYPVRAFLSRGSTTDFLYVDSKMCKNKINSKKTIGAFSKFYVARDSKPTETISDPVKVKVEILDSKGTSVLNQEKTTRFDPKTKIQPNGPRCGPICYKGTVNL